MSKAFLIEVFEGQGGRCDCKRSRALSQLIERAGGKCGSAIRISLDENTIILDERK